MKITGYQTHAVNVPLDDPFIVNSMGTYVILRLQTDQGIEGIGYLTMAPNMVKPFLDLAEPFFQQLIGWDPARIDAITTPQIRFGIPGIIFRKSGSPGMSPRVARLVDVALWDIRGKAANEPVYKLMGGFRDRIWCYASYRTEPGTEYDKDLAGTARYLVEEMGFTAMKFHVRWMDHKQTVNHMRQLREGAGPDIAIMVDNFQGWTPKEAIRMANDLRPYDPYWIEDPVSLDDYEGMRQLREATDINICAGEQYRTLAQFREALEHRSVDIAMIDLDLGLSGVLKVSHMAEAFEVPVVSHLATEAMAHAMAAVPNGLVVEYIPWMNAVLKEPYALENGEIVLPDKPGLGLELDEKALEKLALK